MQRILSPEDKKYLRFLTRYFRSVGMRDGEISIEMDYHEDELPDPDKIDWSYVSHFSNNYSVEVPVELRQIIKKILSHLRKNARLNNNFDSISYQALDITIDSDEQEISVRHTISYYDVADGQTIDYDSEEDGQRFDKWKVEYLDDREIPSDGILYVEYNGGGDSGYIEGNFEPTNEGIPARIEDWCYEQLERNFGGWEINEGSQGRFIFNFNDLTAQLQHVYNVEESQSDTIYEEKFSQ
jgi:hypothetical protein